MSIAISSSLSNPTNPANDSSTPAVVRAPQPVPDEPSDTVLLSDWQRVYQLHNQGQRVSQIAISLNLPVSVVNKYLGISNNSS